MVKKSFPFFQTFVLHFNQQYPGQCENLHVAQQMNLEILILIFDKEAIMKIYTY